MTTRPPIPFAVPLSRKWITGTLAALLACFILAHFWFQYLRYFAGGAPWSLDWMFSVDEEQSLPTWFSSATLSLAAALLLAIAVRTRREGGWGAVYWYGLAIGFALMSLDEIAGLHETVNTYLSIPWTVPGMILAAGLGLLYLRFLIRLPARTRWGFLAAGVSFVGGEMGVQFYISWYLLSHSMNSFGYNVLAGIDKALKMGGEVLFVYALLTYMMNAAKADPEIVLEPGP